MATRRPATKTRARRSDAGEHEESARMTGNGEDRGQAPDGLSDNVGTLATAAAVGVGAALIEADLVPGILIGVGAILLGKMFPQVGAVLRPIVKTVVRAGLIAAEQGRELAAEASEQVQDVIAEVQSEREQEVASVTRRRRAAPAEAHAAA